ncbi:site-specific recombinase XerD [Afipia massiliensis]|uniref:Site-specific recombinase XerD n=1 Tax=Afipia massiliensis TaxID=211460 RepID=A0A840N328_9BRAD|nr:site-specific integrase [Afipia massiliensis]MBB5051136.1 site-specific recombinase XerD [Afipia massiliensis]
MTSVRSYLAAEKSANTRRAYAKDWADFSSFCKTRNEGDLPATAILVAQYLAQLADGGKKASTIERRVAAIRYVHKAAGHEPPTNAEGVKAVMRGIRRRLGKKQVRKAPATAELLELVLAKLPATTAGLRDRALLLIGFAAALRRSELVDLNVNDITWRTRGIILNIGRSKTDQAGEGADIPVPRGGKLKPVQALEAWIATAGIIEGPIFREVDRHGRVGSSALSDRSVARIVKRAFAAIGANVDDFAGHSLRAGFVTTSLEYGIDAFKIMGITRHVKVDTLKTYDRRERGFDDHAGDDFL